MNALIDLLTHCLNFILHVDQTLQDLLTWGGVWCYFVLFLVIFCETGLIFCPLLPGDSLLFATGALAANSTLNIHILAISLSVAAILGDAVNYSVGHWVGPKVFTKKGSRWFNPEYLQRTHDFFNKYGPKTIVIARFIPILRTFAPFIAGIGHMPYLLFAQYNVLSALLWINLFLYVSYHFGNLPLVQQNFSLVILFIIFLSLLPPIVEFIRYKYIKRGPSL